MKNMITFIMIKRHANVCVFNRLLICLFELYLKYSFFSNKKNKKKHTIHIYSFSVFSILYCIQSNIKTMVLKWIKTNKREKERRIYDIYVVTVDIVKSKRAFVNEKFYMHIISRPNRRKNELWLKLSWLFYIYIKHLFLFKKLRK